MNGALSYRTVPLTVECDLNNVCRGDGMLFVRNGVGMAGRGVAALASDTDAMTLLASVKPRHGSGANDAPGAGPILFGLVPFLPGSPSTFFLPRLTIAKHSDGSENEGHDDCENDEFDPDFFQGAQTLGGKRAEVEKEQHEYTRK